MRKLLIYLKDYTKESILAPLFKMLEAILELFVPLVVAYMIDRGIGYANKTLVVQLVLALVGLAAVGLICSITAQYFAAKAAVGFATNLRRALFHHIQNLSFTEMDTAGTSTLITRMTSDMNQVQSGVNMTLRLFLRSPFIVFGAMIMAFTVDVKAAMIFVVTIPVLFVVVFAIILISIPLYKKVQASLDTVLGATRENLTGARVIRAFNKEAEEEKNFREKNNALTRIQKFVGKFSGLMNPVTYIIINGATVVLIWTGALRVESGALTQGAVVALVNYMAQILVELIKFANLVVTMTKALACANRIESVFEIEPTKVLTRQQTAAAAKDTAAKMAEQDEKAPVVEFRDVCLTYKNAGAESLTDLNFRVERGQTVGIIGGTGSGKSSLVNLIPRFYRATKGQVLLEGVDIDDYPLDTLRDMVGVVLQKAILFKGTIRENLQWGSENATDEELMEALTIAQAKEFVDKKEEGLDAFVDQGGKNLSGGQKQRLTIARAVIKKPEILILDDSASALDFATDARLRRAIRDMEDAPTVFVVSQRAATVQSADLILVLDDGCIAGSGTHEELMASCKVYREIYTSQIHAAKGVAAHA